MISATRGVSCADAANSGILWKHGLGSGRLNWCPGLASWTGFLVCLCSWQHQPVNHPKPLLITSSLAPSCWRTAVTHWEDMLWPPSAIWPPQTGNLFIMVFNYQHVWIEAYYKQGGFQPPCYKEARNPECWCSTSNKSGISRPTMDPPKTTKQSNWY